TTDTHIHRDFSDWSQPPPSSSSAILHHSSHNHQQSCPPPHITHKNKYCDGSFVSDSQEAAFGFTVKDTQGHIVDGGNGTFLCSSPIAAEARYVLEATIYATQSLTPFVIHSDCISAVISSILSVSCYCPWITFMFTQRRNNREAEWVAKSTHLLSLPDNWLEVINIVATNL
ncbi:hypothetical protein LINGRAHAP2_LOCUS8463, partial [Linum grandiflorum]